MNGRLGITPPYLRAKLRSAIERVNKLGRKKRTAMLAAHRRNMTKCIATWGIKPETIGLPVEGLEYIPDNWYFALRDLEDALGDIQRYRRPQGAHEFMATRVMQEISRSLAKRKKKGATDRAAKAKMLLKRYGHESSLNKVDIVQRVANELGVSLQTAYRYTKNE